MPLTKLQFKPGVVKDTTAYSNEGGWVDSDHVRFRFGYPEKIGGWQSRTNDTILGTSRALHSWQSLNSTEFIGIGTHLKYYIESGGNAFNVTPMRLTVMIPARPSGVSGITALDSVAVALEIPVSASGNVGTGSVGDVTITIA